MNRLTLLAASIFCAALIAQDGALDTTFNANFTGSSVGRSLGFQPDGKMLVCGSAVPTGTLNGIKRLNPDGTADATFNVTVDSNAVNALILQPDGKVVFGGNFISVNSTPMSRIARVNPDGSLDSTFNPGAGPDSYILCMVRQSDGKFLIGGFFTMVAGASRNYVARLNADGSLDTTFNPGTGASTGILALALQADGKVIVGGNFVTFNGVARNRIARLNADGSLDATFDPNASNSVYATAVQSDGKILVGGNFTSIGGATRTRVARLNPDGSADATFDPGIGPDSYVQTIVRQADGKYIVGGAFNNVNGAAKAGFARLIADGSADSGFNPGGGTGGGTHIVNTVAFDPGGKIIIAGYFTSVNGVARVGVARLNNPSNYIGATIVGTPVDFPLHAPQTDTVVLRLQLMATNSTQSLTSMTFTRTGTVSDASISAVRLARDNNANGLVDAGDSVLGTGTLSGGKVTFAGALVTGLTPATPVSLLLAISIPAPLPLLTTVQFEITSTADVTWTPGADYSTYPITSSLGTQRMAGGYTINQTAGDFNDIGAAFDALEASGVSAPVILTITDSATYNSTPSYSLGLNHSVSPAKAAHVAGVSATNRITLTVASGQTPVVLGSASGAVLGPNQVGATAQTGRGGIAVMESFVTVEALTVASGPNFGIVAQGNNDGSNADGLYPTGVLIRRCRVHGIPDGPGIALFGRNHFFAECVVENNFVWDCLTNSVPNNVVMEPISGAPACITLVNADTTTTLRHNTVLNTSLLTNTAAVGALHTGGTSATGGRRWRCENNIVVSPGAATYAIRIAQGPGGTDYPDPQFTNFNCWFGPNFGLQGTIGTSLTPISFTTGWQPSLDSNGLNVDPQLVSSTGNIDLHLQPTSPCINRLGQISTMQDDVDGEVRIAGAQDIGADEAPPAPAVALINNSQDSFGVTPPQIDATAMRFSILNFGLANSLTSITFTQTGTIADAQISNMKIIRDNNNDGLVDGGDTVLSSGVLAGGKVTFGGSALTPVPQGQAVPLLLAVSVPNPLNISTMRFEILSAADITWSPGPDLTVYPFSSGVGTQRMVGNYTINQTSGDFTDIGAAFDALEICGVSGPVTLTITDSATYNSTPSYSLGLNHNVTPVRPARIAGVSATNRVTLTVALGQTPVVVGSSSGAVLGTTTATGTTQLTGRGGIAVMESFVTIEGLTVTGGPNFGIFAQSNNHGTSADGFYPTNVTVRRCKVHGIPDGPGIAFFAQSTSSATHFFSDCLIENNFVWDCHTNSIPAVSVIQGSTSTAGCIALRGADITTTVRHNTVLNTSTVARTGGIAASHAPILPAAARAWRCDNNIVVSPSPNTYALRVGVVGNRPAVAFTDLNCWFVNEFGGTGTTGTITAFTFNDWKTGGWDPNGMNVDPQLISATGAIDLHVLPTSPCRNPAGQTSTVMDDIDGEPRQAGLQDIGADEANSPGIELSWNTSIIAHNGNFNAGTLLLSTATQFTFTIRNTGVGTLQLNGSPTVVLTPGSNLDTGTAVSAQPAQTSLLGVTGTTTFMVTVDPTASGPFDFTLSVANNTQSLNPFVFTVSGLGNSSPTMVLPAAGSAFSGSASAGFTASVAPGSLPTDMALELFDVDGSNVSVTAVAVAPSAPAGITAPGASSGNPSGTVISFGGNAAPTVPGTYTWTFTLSDGDAAPVQVTASITVQDLPVAHGIGFNAMGGDGSTATPYLAEVALGALAPIELATATDPNTAQTLSLTGVTPDGANPSAALNAGFVGTGNAGSVQVSAAAPITFADVGVHRFKVTLTDGTSNVGIELQVTVQNAGNVPPVAALAAGSAFSGDQTTGFTLDTAPGAALANAALVLSDSDADNIEIVAVNSPGTLAGVTTPAAAAAAPGPITISWTGTADASSAPGPRTYNVTIRDGISTPLTFQVTINVLDLPPTHAAGANATGDGSTALPYVARIEAKKATPLQIAVITDPNSAQPLTLSGVMADPANPAGGVGFTFTLATGVVTVTPNGALRSKDLGTHRFTVTVSDGANSAVMEVAIRVNSPPAEQGSEGCTGGHGGLPLLAALMLIGMWTVMRRRRAW